MTTHENPSSVEAVLDSLLAGTTPQQVHLALVTSASPDVARVQISGDRELLLPASEWPPHTPLPRAGDRVRVTTGDGIVASATRPEMVTLAVEEVVPEVWRGDVRVMGAARLPGVRAKVAVAPTSPDVDAVSACVGRRAARVRRIAELLGGERVDVIAWHDDPATYVANALAPSSVSGVEIAGGRAVVSVPEHQMATAVGAAGQNAQLASQLTGYTVTIVGVD